MITFKKTVHQFIDYEFFEHESNKLRAKLDFDNIKNTRKVTYKDGCIVTIIYTAHYPIGHEKLIFKFVKTIK